MFRFDSPLWLFLLVGLVPVFWRFRAADRPRLTVPTLSMKKIVPLSFFSRTRWIVPAFKVLAFVLVVMSLARPQWGTRETVRLNEGVNIVLAVDLSESMSALDFELNGRSVDRLEAVKAVVRDFIRKRSGDRIGIVVFGSEAYTQMPLTTDQGALVSVVDRMEIGAAGKSTALGDALGVALRRLKEAKVASSVIVLLTDGRSNTGELDPESATEAAADLGFRVHTIGVGGREPAPFRVRDPLFGERIVYQSVEIDEDSLRHIAERTGGRYFHASDSRALREVYETIDRMEKIEITEKSHDRYNDLYPWFVTPAIVLLLFSAVLTNTRYLEVP